jgi:hypothetical protein
MTDIAMLNPPQHPGPTLWLNFAGGGGDAPNNRIKPFQTAQTEQDIQEILFETSEIYAPFNVHVERWFGANNFDTGNAGNTTVFVGFDDANTGTDKNGNPVHNPNSYTPGDSVDYCGGNRPSTHILNSDGHDVCFVDPFASFLTNGVGVLPGNTGDPNGTQTVARAIAHEAGHAFGLAHIRSDNQPESVDPDDLTINPPNGPLGTVGDLMSYNANTTDNRFGPAFPASRGLTYFANLDEPVTAWNYVAKDGKNEFDPDHQQPTWAVVTQDTPIGPIVLVRETINAQNSFTYLQYELGAENAGNVGDYHVVHYNSVDPSVLNQLMPQADNLKLNVAADDSITSIGEHDVKLLTANVS